MAKQKKIDVSLTVTEAQHVREAVRLANQIHQEDLDRSNPALNRAITKIDDQLKLHAEEVRTEDADAAE